jgi:hypothetical protein
MRLGVICNANAEGTVGEAIDRVQRTFDATGTAHIREHTTMVDDRFIAVIRKARALGGLPIAQARLDPGDTATGFAGLCEDIVMELGQITLELGSEPGYPWQTPKINGVEYARYVREASAAIRRAEAVRGCGPCKIVASVDGGYDWGRVSVPGAWMGKWVADLHAGDPDIATRFDISAAHPYRHATGADWEPGYTRPRGAWQAWWGTPVAFGDKPVALTEWGIATAGTSGNTMPAATEQEQADALRTVTTKYRQIPWIWGMFVFMAHDKGSSTSTNGVDNMGIALRRDGTEKPGAAVMRELAAGG